MKELRVGLEESVWIDAPRARVFRALTDPAELVAWWTVPDRYRTEEAEVDLRAGGAYRLAGTMTGGPFEVRGEYLDVVEGQRLRFTWRPSWDDGAWGSVVEFLLEDERGGTRVRVLHTAFLEEASREDHRQGWRVVLGLLAAFTAPD